jgi:hypothetical protein
MGPADPKPVPELELAGLMNMPGQRRCVVVREPLSSY